MFPDYATVTNFNRLPRPDRRLGAPSSEIRLRIKRRLTRRAA